MKEYQTETSVYYNIDKLLRSKFPPNLRPILVTCACETWSTIENLSYEKGKR